MLQFYYTTTLLVKGLKEDELRKEYSYGNYQDKGLSKNKEINMSPQSYVKRKIQQ